MFLCVTSHEKMTPPPKPGVSKLQLIYQGGVLQCLEAASLGMPFEVWKTRMGRFRSETTMESFWAVYNSGGAAKFWQGVGPKMIESATKGGVLMVSKEGIKDACIGAGVPPTPAGFIAGAGGGVCQVSVMGPCTFLVTAMVTGGAKGGVLSFAQQTWAAKGIKGFYPGGSAIAFRQATNWASRQGFTDAVRQQMIKASGSTDGKLTVQYEVLSGMLGGMLACWNHPFEVARIEMQARAAAGESPKSMLRVLGDVYKEWGFAGLFQGVVPRIGLGIWQTTFMVTGANLIREYI